MPDHVATTIATYDRFAADWVEVANNDEIDRWIKDSIRKFVELLPTSKVLVPGCGDGRDSQYLGEIGNEVESFDLSSGMLQFAAKRNVPGRLWQMDLRDVGSLQGKYGIFFCPTRLHLYRAILSLLTNLSAVSYKTL